MEKKTCNKCRKRQSKENFHKASRNVDGLYHTCKSCRVSIDRNRYLTTDKKEKNFLRKKLIQQFIWKYKAERGCNRCDEKDPRCLDFHHMEDNKEFSLADAANFGYAMERIEIEITKCEVICSNCHRKEHVSPPSGWSVIPAKDS